MLQSSHSLGSELLEALALGPAGPKARLLERLAVLFGPDQQQVGLTFAAGFGAVAVGEEPGTLGRGGPEASQQFTENTSDSLSGGQGRGGEGTQALGGGESGTGQCANAEPVLKAPVALFGQPQDQVAIIRIWFPKKARVKDRLWPV